MEAGQYAEAEKTYREDLTQYKENGWSLMGLYQSLTKQGKKQKHNLSNIAMIQRGSLRISRW